MTKKLFVVLVVISALLITFSFVIAAKKAPVVKGPSLLHEKTIITERATATVLPPKGPVEPQTATLVKGTKESATYTAAGPLTGSLNRAGDKDFCDLYGSAAYYITDWFYGEEWYANYQDPEEFGCTVVWPFQVVDVGFNINVDAAISIDVQGFVYSADWTVPDCPVPFQEVCQTPVYTIAIPDAGHWSLGLPLQEECCVYEPYFAVVYIVTDLSGTGADAIAEDMVPCDCRSYNDYGAGWEDLCAVYGWPGPMMLWSDGYTSPQNDCPTEGDTCGVSSVTPPVIQVLPGGAGVFTANVYFQGSQTSCNLVVTPDPVCPSCVTTIVPNPVTDPPVATVTIQTDPTTPAGVYTFDVGGSKAEAAIEVLEPSTDCEMYRDNEAWTSFWGGWVVGDQQVVYFDPEEMCVGCGAAVYPFNVSDMKLMIYNHEGAASMDYILHIYNSTGDPCDGPQEEMLSWEIEGFDSWMTWTLFPLPEYFCVDGPFFFALEFNYDPGVYFPCALWTSQDYGFDCTQWVFYGGGYVAWGDMWVDPKGYMSIRAVGTCDATCPITCDMQQDSYYVGSITTGLEAGDQIVKYYDPEDYCDPVVYPYKIHDLDFTMWDFVPTGVAVDFAVRVYLQCQDSCDGPGTPIYVSDPQTTSDFFGAWVHFDFDEPVCVYEPFFIGIEYLSGTAGSTPGLVFDRLDNQPDPYIPDTCHTYIYDVSAGGVWREHYTFWSTPLDVGYPFIRVSGFTNDPECDPPPCDTVIEMLPGGAFAYYLWPIPDAYGDDYFNERFEMPVDHGGRLEYFDICFDPNGSAGTPDPDFYVWMSDGLFPLDNNPPYQAMADFHITYEEIVWDPGYTRVYTYSRVIEFDPGELFHIGYSHAQEEGDVLAVLSTSDVGSDRSSEWWGVWGTIQADWGVGVDFMIDAYICPFASIGSTFTMKCTPGVGYGTPGDVGFDLYDVIVTAVIGYDLPVTLSLLSVSPDVDITANFDPNPVDPGDTADALISVAVGVAYGNYTLTFQGVGTDDQTRTCDVTLTVQEPYDEGVVHFFHGAQRTSNFGLIASDVNSPNFEWYGVDPLYAGTIVSAMTWPIYDEQEDHMHLVYGGCDMPFTPTQHMVITDDPWCPGSDYEESYGEIAYSNFYAEPSVIPGEFDSLFVIGLRDVECTDFSIKIKIYYNPTQDQYIEELWAALFEDWDITPTTSADWGDMDTLHNMMWMYDPANENIVFGAMKAPFYDGLMNSMVFLHHPSEVYPTTADSCMQCDDATPPQPGGKYLYKLMSQPGYRYPGYWFPDPDDRSILITGPPFSLNPGEKHIEIWIDFGRNLNDGLTWEQWSHRILRYAGFYRGDVNASDTLELPAMDISDLVYLINYLYKGGPAPLPFADQGNVDGKGPYGSAVGDNIDHLCPKNNVDLADVVYLHNHVFRGGPPPVDYVRFIEQFWSRQSLFYSPFNVWP